MANIKSAAKRARRSAAQRARNRRNRSVLKGALKAARSAKPTSDGTEKTLSETYSALDRSVYKGILHKNAAARHKERLAKLLRRTKGSPA